MSFILKRLPFSFFRKASMGSIEAPTKILVIGGSYGGLSAALNLYDLCNGKQARTTLWRKDDWPGQRPIVPVEIKIVDERDGYYHVIGSPLALASESYAEKVWMKFAEMPALKCPGLSWAQGRILNVDTAKKVATVADTISGKEYDENYDYLVVASGLRRQWPTVPQSLTKKEYLSETSAHIRAVKAAKEGVVVIGGGAVGIEMAAELKLVEPKQKVTLIHSRGKLLSNEPLPDDYRDKSAEILRETGVELILNERPSEIVAVESEDGSPRFRLTLKDGSHMFAGNVIRAISKAIPSTSFLPETALDAEGYVKVDSNLNFKSDSPTSRTHFACGDLALWSGIKRCGGAMAQGHLCAANIYRLILQSKFETEPTLLVYPEVPPMIALAVGTKAVVYGPENGTTWGEKEMKVMFRDDLGFAICWEYLQLKTEWVPAEKSVV